MQSLEWTDLATGRPRRGTYWSPGPTQETVWVIPDERRDGEGHALCLKLLQSGGLVERRVDTKRSSADHQATVMAALENRELVPGSRNPYLDGLPTYGHMLPRGLGGIPRKLQSTVFGATPAPSVGPLATVRARDNDDDWFVDRCLFGHNGAAARQACETAVNEHEKWDSTRIAARIIDLVDEPAAEPARDTATEQRSASTDVMPSSEGDAVADDDWESSADAASWTAHTATTAEPTPQTGRAPAMTYMRWMRTQGVEIGGTAVDAWYWRCPRRGCRVWAGPYCDVSDGAKQTGMDHLWHHHDKPNASSPSPSAAPATHAVNHPGNGGEVVDPQAAMALADSIGAVGSGLVSTIDISIANLVARGVSGEPIVHFQRMLEAAQTVVSSSAAARGHFQNHARIQEVALADATVGGGIYLGIGQ